MKKLFLSGLLVLLPLISSAYTVYEQHQTPLDLMQKGNPYGANNQYNQTNSTHPYSQLQDLYQPEAVYNNAAVYAGQTHNINGQTQGTLGGNAMQPSSINNPYGQFGSIYNQANQTHPYNPNNLNNPYSDFKNFYDKNNGFTSPKYTTPHWDWRDKP